MDGRAQHRGHCGCGGLGPRRHRRIQRHRHRSVAPFKAYPWTWDAVGGGSTWWYLPVWWMLGTFLAWMGGVVTAGRAARGGDVSIPALALPMVVGAAIIALPLTLARLHIYLPVAAGAGFTLVLTILAVAVIVRKG